MKQLSCRLTILAFLSLLFIFSSCGNKNETEDFRISNSDKSTNKISDDLNANQIEKVEIDMRKAKEAASKMSISSESISLKERLSLSDIPAGQILNMSTEDLLLEVLNYKHLPLLHSRNELQSGFELLAENHLGLKELLSRKNVVEIASKYYSELNVLDFSSLNSLQEKGAFALKVNFIETLLAQENIVSNLSKSQRLNLGAKVLSNINAKSTVPEIYGYFSNVPPALLIARMLEKDSDNGFKSGLNSITNSDKFIEKGFIPSEEIIQYIFSQGTINYLDRN